MTALTSTSSFLNIDHGDNSRSSRSGGLQQLVTLGRRRGGLCGRGCVVAPGIACSRRCGRGPARWSLKPPGAPEAALLPAGAICCWADEGAVDDKIANAAIAATVFRTIKKFMLRPSSELGCDRCRQFDRFGVIAPASHYQGLDRRLKIEMGCGRVIPYHALQPDKRHHTHTSCEMQTRSTVNSGIPARSVASGNHRRPRVPA